MSDEHDHEHHHHPLFDLFRGPSPQELERVRLQSDSFSHEIRAFFDGLDSEQLRVVNLIMRMIAGNEAVGAYYSGLATTMRDLKFNICLSCSKDHDQMLQDMAEHESPEEPELKPTEDPDEQVSFGSEKYKELAYLYSVAPTGEGLKVLCTNCQTEYQSLQDRMLRKPGTVGCEGCIQKEKWG